MTRELKAYPNTNIFSLTKDQAYQKVLALSEMQNYLKTVLNSYLIFDHEENTTWVFHTYEDLSDHIATYNWYYVNKQTGQITDLLGQSY